MKRKERKRDRTPLDEYTIRAYEGLVQDFIYITKCQYPGDVTGDRVNDWMLVLEDGYVALASFVSYADINGFFVNDYRARQSGKRRAAGSPS